MNLSDFLDAKTTQFADLDFLNYYDEAITYRQFGTLVNKLANGLIKAGFKKGDFIHVYYENHPHILISYFAIQKIGAVAGPINSWWKADEIRYLLNDSGGVGLIIDPQFNDVFEKMKDDVPKLRTVIEGSTTPQPGRLSLQKMIDESPADPVQVEIDEKSPAFIFYTSGTTGDPKGVLLSHKSIARDAEQTSARLGTAEESLSALIFLPLFHTNAMISCVTGLNSGHTIVLRKRFSAGEFWPCVEKYKINFFSAVPAVYNILLANADQVTQDYSSIRFGVCGAAPMPVAVFEAFEKRFGFPIIEGYGLTEATCVSTLNPREGVRKVGSIGLPLDGQDIQIWDESGQDVPQGKTGEIVIKGVPVMLGYHNRPEETKEALAGGFLHTGDVGYKDEDGYIFIVDRIKEMIIRGGENIYPKEIDNLLVKHPKIFDAATVGVPDEMKGEEVKAYVILNDGEKMTEEEAIEYCKDNMAYFKVPKYVQFLQDDFPRNPIGKILKKEIRKWGVEGPEIIEGPQVFAKDIFDTLVERFRPDKAGDFSAKVGYDVPGQGGGKWTATIGDGKAALAEGLAEDVDATLQIAARDWVALSLGQLDGMTAFTTGRLKVTGNMELVPRLAEIFAKFEAPKSVTAADIFATLEDRFLPDQAGDFQAVISYDIGGEGGGQWTAKIGEGQCRLGEGLDDSAITNVVIAAKDWVALSTGKLEPMQAFMTGRLKVEGDVSVLQSIATMFRKFG